MKIGIDAGEKELQRIQQERESEITLVQSLRTIQESTRGNSKERNVVAVCMFSFFICIMNVRMISRKMIWE